MSGATFERGLNALREQIDAPVASFFSSCVHCGMCADACHFYQETGDPQYTPIHKVDLMRRLWSQEFTLLGKAKGLLGLNKAITDEDFTKWETLVYDSCTMCGRCSLTCPVGNDITGMVAKMREGMSASGHGPVELIGAAQRHCELGSPLGNMLPALKAQVKHSVAQTGIECHCDKQGAEYLVVLSAQEVAEFPDILVAYAKIFKETGIDWTISSEAFEATNVGYQIGNSDIARGCVMKIVEVAEKIGAKYVISPECGHAYQALRWAGPNLIGRQYKFEVIHIMELLEKLRKEGKLKTTGRNNEKLTFHDPCQLNRRGGIHQEPRNLLNMFADNFVETDNAGAYNWCCGGGGGVGSNERATELRMKAFNRKKAQFDKVSPDKVVTMCAYCHHVLEDALYENDMEDLEVASLTEMVADYLDESAAK